MIEFSILAERSLMIFIGIVIGGLIAFLIKLKKANIKPANAELVAESKMQIVSRLIREKILDDQVLKSRLNKIDCNWVTCGGVYVPNINITFYETAETAKEKIND
jgi:hypothetical protein